MIRFILYCAVVLYALGAPGAAAPSFAAGAKTTAPSLEERRQLRRERAIGGHLTRCRARAKRLNEMKGTPCAEDDALDARRNLCMPRKGQARPYLRWDPASGRCRPRDKYEMRTCAGARGRYHPGKRHAHSAGDSVRMYGAAPARLSASLKQCKNALGALREDASRRNGRAARDCAISRRLGRKDLVALYCK